MATQVQDILDAAFGKSTKNKAGQIATAATELLGVVKRALYRYFAVIARTNPWMIATEATVGFAAGGWARPTAAQMILRIEETDGTEVVVVPLTDKIAEASLPALYRLGRTFFPAGNANDPTSGDLDFIYARFPTAPTLLTDSIDALWPEEFNECLIHDLALYLATKDGRNDELPGLESEREAWEALLIQFCEHETSNERRRFGIRDRFIAPTKVPA